MNRSDLVILLAGIALLAACGGEEPVDEDWLEDALHGGAAADLAPLPDFHDYVVGDLATPPRTRDPFDTRAYQRDAPSAATPAPTDDPLDLRGIVQSEGRWVALLGHQSVAQGDRIAGWRVLHIDARTVVLGKGMKTKRLSL